MKSKTSIMQLFTLLLRCLFAMALAPLVLSQEARVAEVEHAGMYAPARRWALVIGATGYPHLGELRYAASDAELFSEALIERFGFEPSTVELLTDNTEVKPTAGSMFRSLRKMLADPRLQQTDLFVFYFAGHGVGHADGDFLLPLDGDVETVTDVGLHVREVISNLTSAGMDNVLFVVDGCRTGTQNKFGQELWDLAEEANLAVILSCEPGEQSYEDRRLEGGIFTHFLVESLKDASLFDEESGALWASKVALSAQKKSMAWTSRGFDGQQVPQVWNDPTRDVLLGARLPRESREILSAFSSGASSLDSSRYMASAGRYAELLYNADRFEECAELLKAAEQIGTLPAHLLYLFADSLQAAGRLAEMRRIQSELLERYPESFYALAIIAHDFSGESSGPERYRASRKLWSGWPIDQSDLALLVAFNMCLGGPQAEAREVLDEMLPRFREGTRGHAYALYMSLLLDGRAENGLETLEGAEGLAGTYPDNQRLRTERLGILRELGRGREALAVLDQCVADWPENGDWWAQRALIRYKGRDWEGALADSREALARPLQPWSLMMATRAAGTSYAQVSKKIAEQAANYPLSWVAQLCRASTTITTPEENQKAMDEARRLAPEVGTWTARVASIRIERAQEAFVRDMIDGRMFTKFQFETYDVLAERAGEFNQDQEGWELLLELGVGLSRHTQLATLIDLYLEKAIEAGQIQHVLLGPLSEALLGAGRFETFKKLLARNAPNERGRTYLGWLECAWLVCADRNEEATKLMEQLPSVPAEMRATGLLLKACLSARAGDPESARKKLAEAGPSADHSRLPRALAALTYEALEKNEQGDQLFGVVFRGGGDNFFAKAACWRAFNRRDVDGQVKQGLAFAASRDGIGNPLCAEISFATSPGLDAFRGSVEFQVIHTEGELDALDATLLLTVRKEGKVSGVIERTDGEVWSVGGVIDEFGNLEGELRGAPIKARVLAKLAPPDDYLGNDLLREHGATLLLLDEKGRASAWGARAVP
jgi:tetratricopeptide (TPR) repeat protein